MGDKAPPKKGGDSGWNDPPMFAYDSRPPVSKYPNMASRISFSWSPSSPSASPSSPDNKYTDIPISGPPKGGGPLALSNKQKPNEDNTEAPTSTEETPSVDEVFSLFDEVINDLYPCPDNAKDRADIYKRLQLIEVVWKDNNLPLEVQRKLHKILIALNEEQFEEGDKLQRSLMVDYPSVCSPWMAAIRKLLSSKREAVEKKNLCNNKSC